MRNADQLFINVRILTGFRVRIPFLAFKEKKFIPFPPEVSFLSFRFCPNYFSIYVMPRCTILKVKKVSFSDLDPDWNRIPDSFGSKLYIRSDHLISSISEGVISPAKSESLFPGSATSYPITSRVGPPHKRAGGVLHRPASLFIQSNSSLNTADSIMSSSYGLSGKTFYSKLLLC
jgi:hypothetical protein